MSSSTQFKIFRTTFILGLILFASHGFPLNEGEAVIEEPGLIQEIVEEKAVESVQPPVSLETPVPPAPEVPVQIAPPASPTTSIEKPTAPIKAPEGGNGFITEHRQPDGTVIKITRFNGPLPNSAFSINPFMQSPWATPYASPNFYPYWNQPGMGNFGERITPYVY